MATTNRAMRPTDRSGRIDLSAGHYHRIPHTSSMLLSPCRYTCQLKAGNIST